MNPDESLEIATPAGLVKLSAHDKEWSWITVNAALPFSRTIPLPSGTTLLQVVVVGSTDVNPGCQIKVNGKVVAEKPVGDDAHCVADISGMSFDDSPAPPAQGAKGITYEVKGPGTAVTINIWPAW